MENYNKQILFQILKISTLLIISGILSQLYFVIGQSNYISLDTMPSFAFVQGNTISSLSNPANPPPKVVKELPVIITAYSSTKSQTDDTPFITASGSSVKDGIVANNLLPFGTKIRIPEIYGDKIFVVEDRMHRRKGYYHVDVWFSDYWQAKNFGAQLTTIEVLES
jgi:3D (Asp-Asp-Asp) domain-containing protein